MSEDAGWLEMALLLFWVIPLAGAMLALTLIVLAVDWVCFEIHRLVFK